MPLLFTKVCDLLSALEAFQNRDPPLLPDRLKHRTNEIIKSWFVSHHVSVSSPNIDAVALLSTLFPSKRTDRVYSIQPTRLTRGLRRWLSLGRTRWPMLDEWQEPGRGDLGDCVERVMRQAEFPNPLTKDRVTVEEVDSALESVAARCRSSAPKVRARGADEELVSSKVLENIYRRLQSRDAKWLTRLILKNFACLELPEALTYSYIDPRLSIALRIYHDFESAVSEVKNLSASQMADASLGGFTRQCTNDAHLMAPKVGVKVGPPNWVKAKGGIKHAVSMIDGRTMSLERKHDGEYCQIHVDLSKGEDCIQIFSKSGKDSTEDRKGVHGAILDGLRIGTDDCKFSEKCILEGELVVYSNQTKDVLGFHKIRKHVPRSGSFLGTALDSQAHYWEHLMIIFYDVMLIDDEATLHQPYGRRRKQLEKLVKHIEGHSEVVQQRYIGFSTPRGSDKLKEGLASALVHRWEGLVLKPADDPYFQLTKSMQGRYTSRWIKLKKDCIKGLGDTADFAVLGAGFDAARSSKVNPRNLRWTHFYIGCLRNKQDVLRFDAKPRFFVFDQISDCIKKEDLKRLNELGYLRALSPDSNEAQELFTIELASGLSRMSTIFRVPFVFDVAGSGFDKSPNRDIFTLRFPRVMKIHWDRDWEESVSLDELQDLASQAMKIPAEEQWWDELEQWMEKLSQIDDGSKGQYMSWDVSGEEGNDDEFLPVAASSTTSTTNSRRSRTPVAPVMVRMDTKEMTDRERRPSAGEMIERPMSKHSMAGNGSVQKTPPSSPLFKSHGREPGQQTSLSARDKEGKLGKRSSAEADLQESSRQTKRRQAEHGQQTEQSSRNQQSGSSKASLKRPLQDVTNSARPPSPSKDTKKLELAKYPLSKTFLVRKLPPGADDDVHQRQVKRRKIYEPSETSQKTTASERSKTSTITCSTNQHTSPLKPTSSPPPNPPMATLNPKPLPPPPSIANQPPAIKVPDLKETKLVLADLPIKTLLDSHSLTYSSLRFAAFCPRSNSMLHSTPNPTKRILLLVDAWDTTNTRIAMGKLLKNVEVWHPIEVEVWDWGILEVVGESKEWAEDPANQEMIRQQFMARLRWVEEVGEEGAVEVWWNDGRDTTTMVKEEDFERVVVP